MMLVSTSLLITTLDLSAESVNDLEVGMVDKAVIELEEDLKELGFASNEESTEKFDEDTKESIKSFQSYFDLEVNGKANEETLNKIDDILSSPFREGEYHEETIKLKKLLKSLGYWDTSSPTPFMILVRWKWWKHFKQTIVYLNQVLLMKLHGSY